MQNIKISVSVCLSFYLFVCPLAYLKNTRPRALHAQISPNLVGSTNGIDPLGPKIGRIDPYRVKIDASNCMLDVQQLITGFLCRCAVKVNVLFALH